MLEYSEIGVTVDCVFFREKKKIGIYFAFAFLVFFFAVWDDSVWILDYLLKGLSFQPIYFGFCTEEPPIHFHIFFSSSSER